MKKSIILMLVLLFSLFSIGAVEAYQCDDGDDNDWDGRTDEADAGCHTDQGVYDPDANDEGAWCGFCSDDYVPDELGETCFTEKNFDYYPMDVDNGWILCAWVGDHSDLTTKWFWLEEPLGDLIPEFSTITAGLALLGAGMIFMFMRRGERK
ncbi:MAG: hypothetical protein ABIB47_00470 [Candidatus Woesearchaeota archaeon]